MLLSLFNLNLCADPFSLLDFYSFGLSKLLPSLFFRKFFGYWKRVVFDLRLEGMLLGEFLLCFCNDLLCFCYFWLRLVSLFLQISINSWLHVVSADLD